MVIYYNVADIRYDPSRVQTDRQSPNEGSNVPLVDDNLYSVISEHCLPKLVCELHSKLLEEFESFSESEKSLVSLIG